MQLNKELLDILACPLCMSDVRYEKKKNLLFCINKKCGKKYNIKEGVPIMLV